MIASLHGQLESISTDSAIINVSGVGFLVYMPTSTITTLGRIGHEVHLQTNLVVREDSMTLYGFATDGELELFQVLTGVSGLGPKLALAMLSSMSVEQVSTAIATDNIDLLTAIPGIGKKMANRLVLELKDKISTGLISAPAAQLAEENAEVVAALTSLGYSIAESSRAVATLPDSVMSLEEKIKLALQYFTS
ncbi:MAG: Holliday junction branch migration protein RuvA [Dehalococcoidales bacterium]|nr:MAG: Holliday junction branch migration protein RuvA [Dehalococcoidales bacterium]